MWPVLGIIQRTPAFYEKRFCPLETIWHLMTLIYVDSQPRRLLFHRIVKVGKGCHSHLIQPVPTSRGSDSTTSLGSLCWCPATRSEKEFLLIPKLNLCRQNLRPFLPVLLLLPEKTDQQPSRHTLISGSCRATKFPLSFLFSKNTLEVQQQTCLLIQHPTNFICSCLCSYSAVLSFIFMWEV